MKQVSEYVDANRLPSRSGNINCPPKPMGIYSADQLSTYPWGDSSDHIMLHRFLVVHTTNVGQYPSNFRRYYPMVISLIGDANDFTFGIQYLSGLCRQQIYRIVDGNGTTDANGSVDSNTPGIYQITYTKSDSSGIMLIGTGRSNTFPTGIDRELHRFSCL